MRYRYIGFQFKSIMVPSTESYKEINVMKNVFNLLIET